MSFVLFRFLGPSILLHMPSFILVWPVQEALAACILKLLRCTEACLTEETMVLSECECHINAQQGEEKLLVLVSKQKFPNMGRMANIIAKGTTVGIVSIC